MALKAIVTLGSVNIYDVRGLLTVSAKPVYYSTRTITGDTVVQITGSNTLDDVFEIDVRIDETTMTSLKALVGQVVNYTDIYGRSLSVFVAEIEERGMVPITQIYNCVIKIIPLEEV